MHFLSLTHFNVTVPTLCVDSKGVGKGLSGQGGDVAGSALLALETLVSSAVGSAVGYYTEITSSRESSFAT